MPIRFLVFFCAAISLFSALHEIANFNEIANYVNEKTTVVLDIDDTLIMHAQMLGGDAWFDYRVKKYEAEGHSFETALDQTIREYQAIQYLSSMRLVEEDIPKVVSSLQKKGVPVIGLTIREFGLAKRTLLQLREQGIDLSSTAIDCDDFCCPIYGHTLFYRKGVVFTSGKAKGESFFCFCDKTGHLPKRLVAIDDKLLHLLSLEKEANARGIEFIGLRYGYADGKKKAFSPEIAEYQMAHSTLTHLLSDHDAKTALAQKLNVN